MVQKLFKKYLIVMIICIVIGLFIFYASSVIVEGIVENSLTEIARQGTLIVNKNIEAHMNILRTISQTQNIHMPDMSLEQRVHILQNYTSIDKFLRLSIVDVDGRVISTDGKIINIADREYFKKAMAGIPNISEPLVSRIDNSTVIVFAVPLTHEGKIVGIISATYPVQELSDIIDDIHYAGKGYAYIMDDGRNIIAHGTDGYTPELRNAADSGVSARGDQRLNELESRMVRGETGAGDYQLDHQEKFIGFAPIADTGWTLALTATRDEVFADLNRLLTFLILLILCFSATIFIVNAYLIYLKKRISLHQRTSQNAVDIAKMIMISFDENGIIIAFNRYAEEKTGYSRDDILGKKLIYDLMDEPSGFILRNICAEAKSGQNVSSFELSFKNASGESNYILFNINHSDVYNKKNHLAEDVELIGVDLTDRVKAEKALNEKHHELSQVYEELSASQDELHSQFERIYQLAFYDSLTKLPNRAQFQQHLTDLLRDRRDRSIATLIIDVDNFKYINDTFGYHYGNTTLKEMAERLQKTSEGRFFIARLNGDEFSAIIEQPFYDEPALAHIAEDIFESLKSPFNIGNIKLNISASIGIAANVDRSVEADTLLSYADAAMNKAKERGKSGYVFFDKSMTKEISDKLIMTNYLRDAIQNNEFRLFYQPKYDTKTRQICSFEGLLRWNHPVLGNVPPTNFIKLAEESGQIQAIGLWVLKEGCSFAKRINEGREKKIAVSINVSPLQIVQDQFLDQFKKVLLDVGVEPAHIAIEITETAMIEVFDSCLKKLEVLKQMGIKIYLDDFGTGYSSLNYLSKLPISVIKLDRSFIREIITDEKVKQLTQTIITLSHQLGMDTVAEGVETMDQFDILKDYGCDIVQGYLFSKPVPEENAIGLIAESPIK